MGEMASLLLWGIGENVHLTDTVNLATGALQKNQNGADIPDKPLFVRTLGIVDSYPVGCPIPYPGPVAPDGYLLMDGRVFSTALYPQLAKLYPNGELPDMRGMFVRGWDKGRGLDTPNGYDGNCYKVFSSSSTGSGSQYSLRGYEITTLQSDGRCEGARALLKPQFLDSVISDREPETNRLLHTEHYSQFKTTPQGDYQSYSRCLSYYRGWSGISFSRTAVPYSFTPDYEHHGMVRLGAPNITFNYITKAA
ncbi:tail fiber protein [Salmonella enterica subsp. enterica]|uniref:Tail fiber protein n=1 Tax=Salmonella enterica subsp. enterica serovar Telelkebir TaxID=1967657 RepID=A0A610BY79_SALET|nr:tail fiber protein [Salmonella enterica subsp. enterica serovar Telelkebir]